MDGRSGLADRRGNDSSSGVHFVSVGVIAFVPSKLTAWENCSEWVDGIGVRCNIRLNRLYCSSSRNDDDACRTLLDDSLFLLLLPFTMDG